MTEHLTAVRTQYLQAQVAGDRRAALQIVRDALALGHSVRSVRQRVVQAAQQEIGKLWQENRLSIAHEHRATVISQLALDYTDPQPGLVPFHRCLLPNSQHNYSTSATCDDIATPEGSLGHVAVTPVCGAVPHYRLSNGVHANYLYTHDPAERDDAIAHQGYLYEAIAGHVWPGP